MQSFPSIVVYPSHRDIFLVKELATILRIESSFLGFGVLFPLDLSRSYFVSCRINS
jgi:hypothetical protein